MMTSCELYKGLFVITQCDEFGEPWDFNKKHMREKARTKLLEQEPELLVGSPMCRRSVRGSASTDSVIPGDTTGNYARQADT